jgi:DNA-binding transcriptional ArsR family regulator
MAEPASVLHELGDATRLRVFVSLLGGRKNVSQIVSELSLAQPQVSYHLRKLKEAGLAVEQRDGRWVWYEANWETEDGDLQEFIRVLAGWSGLSAIPEKGGRAGRAGGTRRAVTAQKKARASAKRPGASAPTKRGSGARRQSPKKQGRGGKAGGARATRKSPRKPRGAGVMRPTKARKIPVVSPTPDELEERPQVERPTRTTTDMDDFLL